MSMCRGWQVACLGMAQGWSCQLHGYLSISMRQRWRWGGLRSCCYTSGLTVSSRRMSRLFDSTEDAASNSQFLHLKLCKLYGGEKYQKSKNTKVCQRAKREISYFFLRKTSFDSFPSFLLFSSPAPLSSL